MKNKIQRLSFIFLCFLISTALFAQKSYNSSGGDATGNGGSVAYSIGQVVYNTNKGNTGSVAQGVQHPYEIYSLGIDEPTIDIAMEVFPNPTTDNLTLQMSEYNKEQLEYKVYDMQGKSLFSGKILSTKTNIGMRNLPTGTYFINIMNKNKKVKTFKIIKN